MQKPVAHTSIWLRKRESDILNWNVWCSKSQRLNHNVEISKISSTDLKKRCSIQKVQLSWIMQKPNEKFLKFVIILLWEVIYAHFYNWDRLLDFVSVVYDLIELIIEASLWSMDYSTFDTHTQHTSNVHIMLISFVWLYMFKCDVYAQFLVNQIQKYF